MTRFKKFFLNRSDRDLAFMQNEIEEVLKSRKPGAKQ